MAIRVSDILLGRLNVFGKSPVRRTIPNVDTPKILPHRVSSKPSRFWKILSKFDIQEYVTSLICFAPSNKSFSTPADRGIVYEEVFIKTFDGEALHGYFLPAKEKTDKVMLFLHGNDFNVDLWYVAPVNLQEHVPVNALIVDYRGYGKSTGKPTPSGIITDALAMYDYLLQKGYKPDNISVYGRSLGGGIALELASRVPVRSVVIQSSFYSLRDLKAIHIPKLPSILVKGNFLNSKDLIKDVHVPVLISHGTKDEKVPLDHAFRLYEKANNPKKLILLEGAGHEHLKAYYTKEYFQTLREMFL